MQPENFSNEEGGWPKVTKELHTRGFKVGKERVRKLMQLHDIKAKEKRKFVDDYCR